MVGRFLGSLLLIMKENSNYLSGSPQMRRKGKYKFSHNYHYKTPCIWKLLNCVALLFSLHWVSFPDLVGLYMLIIQVTVYNFFKIIGLLLLPISSKMQILSQMAPKKKHTQKQTNKNNKTAPYLFMVKGYTVLVY